MMRLVLLALLPQIGGILLMVGQSAKFGWPDGRRAKASRNPCGQIHVD
jgi:hypothetical protein